MAKPNHTQRISYKGMKDHGRADARRAADAEAANPSRTADDALTESDLSLLRTTLNMQLANMRQSNPLYSTMTGPAMQGFDTAIDEARQRHGGNISFAQLRATLSERRLAIIGSHAQRKGFGDDHMFGTVDFGQQIARVMTDTICRFIGERVKDGPTPG